MNPGIGMENPLEVAGIRVLGSLVEKERTTPDNYPLTLNALTAACNQTSNREPVLALDPLEVARAIQDLDRRALVRAVYRSDSRAKRYRHLLAETLHLHPAEMAVLCVLMLRGPQTVGELRTRAARLFEFPDLARVEITLQALLTLAEPLVTELPRRPGQKEARFAHLLGGAPAAEASGPTTPTTTTSPTTTSPATTRRGDPTTGGNPAAPGRVDALEQDVAALRAEVAELRSVFEEFRREFE
jgi:uncharacterized protein